MPLVLSVPAKSHTSLPMTMMLTTPEALAAKADQINGVLSEPNVDLWKLRELAISEGGLVNDSIRKRAWPKLVGLHDLWRDNKATSRRGRPIAPLPPRAPPSIVRASPAYAVSNNENDDESNNNDDDSVLSQASLSSRNTILTASLDFDQIERDVARCTWHLLSGTQRQQRMQMEHKRNKRIAKLIRRKQRRLANLINLTLVKSYAPSSSTEKLRYYQGYHDVACIFLSALGGSSGMSVNKYSSSMEGMAATMGLDLPAAVLLQVSQFQLRDCLQANFLQLQTALRLTLFPLMAKFDPDVHRHLYESDMEPFFALSWVITWFSHEIRDTELVKRMFDVFLVSHPLFPIYVSVAMVVHPVNRQEVLECECDFTQLHQVLTGLPKNSSMFGWKYRPGDGYVSDHDADDGTVSTGTMDQSADAEFLLVEREQKRESDAQSLVSSTLSSMEPPAPVPFQEIIDDAIDIMRRVPPRKLIGLATRYYGKEQVNEYLQMAPTIHMFESPPLWAVNATAKADWLLRQEARRGTTTRKTRRNDRKRTRSRSRSRSNSRTRSQARDATKGDSANSVSDYEIFLKENSNLTPVIAAGFGPGDDIERRRRKRRRLLFGGALAFVVLAVAVGAAIRYNREAGSPKSESSDGFSPPASECSAAQRRKETLSISAERPSPVIETRAAIPVPVPRAMSTTDPLGMDGPGKGVERLTPSVAAKYVETDPIPLVAVSPALIQDLADEGSFWSASLKDYLTLMSIAKQKGEKVKFYLVPHAQRILIDARESRLGRQIESSFAEACAAAGVFRVRAVKATTDLAKAIAASGAWKKINALKTSTVSEALKHINSFSLLIVNSNIWQAARRAIEADKFKKAAETAAQSIVGASVYSLYY